MPAGPSYTSPPVWTPPDTISDVDRYAPIARDWLQGGSGIPAVDTGKVHTAQQGEPPATPAPWDIIPNPFDIPGNIKKATGLDIKSPLDELLGPWVIKLILIIVGVIFITLGIGALLKGPATAAIKFSRGPIAQGIKEGLSE